MKDGAVDAGAQESLIVLSNEMNAHARDDMGVTVWELHYKTYTAFFFVHEKNTRAPSQRTVEHNE